LALLVLLAGGSGKPKVELKASPAMAVLPSGPRPAIVSFKLTIKHGGNEDFYCPKLEWRWQDDTTSVEESDCPPFEQASPGDQQRTWTRARQFWEPGEHRISVRLYKGDRLIRTIDTRVEVSGEAVPGRFRER
jgi:hypothetical protein